MSFVNKIKGWGQKGTTGPEHDALEHDAAYIDINGGGSASLAPTDLPLADIGAVAAFDAQPTHAGDEQPASASASSIISEAQPSETAEFSETRLQDSDQQMAPTRAALPLGMVISFIEVSTFPPASMAFSTNGGLKSALLNLTR